MRDPEELPQPIGSRAFAVGAAHEAGVGDHRLRHALARPFRGVRRYEGAVSTPEDDYLPRIAEGEVFSHVSAARIYRLPLPRRLANDPDVHVMVEKPTRASKATGVIGHPEHMRTAVEQLAGRRGTPALRRALERVRARTDSPKETEIRLAIIDAGLPEPEVRWP